MKHWKLGVAGLLLVGLLAACGTPQTASQLDNELARSGHLGDPTYTEVWDGRGADSEKCRVPDTDDPRFPLYDSGEGWVHWVFATKGASTDARLYIGADVYEPGEPLNANIWHFYTPFMDLDDLEELEPYVELFGGARGPGGGLVISDYCPGDKELSVDVRKTAFAEFDREHHWLIDKSVDTENGYELDGYAKIWLFTDGSGDEKATWTVDVTYDGYTDSDFVVYGEIEIVNISTSEADKVITSITDDLGIEGYDDIALDCGEDFALPYTIAFGEVLTCEYRVEFADGVVEQGDFGTNSVTVLVEGDDNVYGATADWEFDEPETELYATVNIKDISDLFGEVHLGTVTAPNGAKFTYYKEFAFEYYGELDECGGFRYDNTATIVETEQSADATLKVNVQCFIWESAWAKGVGEDVEAKAFCDSGFSNWGWTNEITNPYTGSWPLYAGAGQCDTDKGTLVGTFTVSYYGGFSYAFNVDEGYASDDAAVYADTAMFPVSPDRRGGPTTAPGQYYVADDLDGAIHVIAHVNVGTPDPDFGPEIE